VSTLLIAFLAQGTHLYKKDREVREG